MKNRENPREKSRGFSIVILSRSGNYRLGNFDASYGDGNFALAVSLNGSVLGALSSRRGVVYAGDLNSTLGLAAGGSVGQGVGNLECQQSEK